MTESRYYPDMKDTKVPCKLCGKPTLRAWTVVLADDEILNQEHLMGDLAPHFWVDTCAGCFYLCRGYFAEHTGTLGLDVKKFKALREKY